ncbi:MAG: hypothetical protein J4452_03840 [Candidatus Aenigmarchaeota archaeon]|nr:hypothetical protein [Candidatus Aenigmarchaeota archaeon]
MKSNTRKKLLKNDLLLALVFVVSTVMLILEIVFYRIVDFVSSFTTVLQVLPPAFLGVSLGSLLVTRKISQKIFIPSIFLLSLSIFAAYFGVIYSKGVFLRSFFLALPFLFSGFIITFSFKYYSRKNIIYALNIVGSGLGIVISFFAFGMFTGEDLLLISAFIVIIPLLIFYYKRPAFFLPSLFLSLIFLGILSFNSKVHYFDVLTFATNNTETEFIDNHLINIIVSDKTAKVLYTKWSVLSRADVTNESNELFLYTNGIGQTRVANRSTVLDRVYPIFKMRMKPEVLVIGPGGGRDISTAKAAGAEKIVAVEIDPNFVSLMQNELANISGNVYGLADIYTKDGRAYVSNCENEFDIIHLGHADYHTGVALSPALTENYLYTKEAVKDYIKCLKNDGFFALKFGQGFTFQFIDTVFTAMKEMGYDGPEKNIVFFSFEPDLGSGYTLVKKSEFSSTEFEMLNKSYSIPIYFGYFPGTNVKTAYEQKIIASKGQLNNLSYVPTDDKPYPFEMDSNHSQLKELFLNNVAILFLFAILPISFSVRSLNFNKEKVSLLIYFSLIGMGYLLLQVILVQKFSLFLESPINAFIIVLATMMLSSGLGGYFSKMFSYKLDLYLMFLDVLIIFSLIYLLPSIFENFTHLTILEKSLIVLVIVAPISFLLGFPFPIVLEKMKEAQQTHFIPYTISINAAFASFGSTLALVLSPIYGFNVGISVVALFYFISLIVLLKIKQP